MKFQSESIQCHFDELIVNSSSLSAAGILNFKSTLNKSEHTEDAAFARKLRCPRNLLHVNLFLSFILRALLALSRDALMSEGTAISDDVIDRHSASLDIADDSSVRNLKAGAIEEKL